MILIVYYCQVNVSVTVLHERECICVVVRISLLDEFLMKVSILCAIHVFSDFFFDKIELDTYRNCVESTHTFNRSKELYFFS